MFAAVNMSVARYSTGTWSRKFAVDELDRLSAPARLSAKELAIKAVRKIQLCRAIILQE